MFLVVVQLLSRVQLFATPWTAAHQASLSFTVSQSLLKLTSIESVMPSNHHILSPPSLPSLNLSQHQGLFQRVGSSHQGTKVLELQLQHQSFQWIFRVEFPLGLTGLISLLSKSLLQHQFESINCKALSFLYAPPLTSVHDYWKNCTLDYFVGKLMSLLFNMLSRFVITFLPRSSVF